MPSLSLACTRFSNLIMFESILLHNFIFCLFKHGLCLNFFFTRRYIRGLCYTSRGGHCFNFFQVWISLVSVKEFIIAIIICKMRNSVGLLFFYQTESYERPVIILYTCVCMNDLNVDILGMGVFLKFHFF